LAVFLASLISCDNPVEPEPEKEKNVPVLSTTEPFEIKEFSAFSGGNIISDQGLTVTARGVCWSRHQNPSIEDDTTYDGTGAGAFTSFLTGLEDGTEYYIRAYAINEDGIGYGSALLFTTYPYDTVGTFTDVEGNVYQTVRINDQWWLAENLRQTHRNSSGDSLSADYYYDNGKYGVLYHDKVLSVSSFLYSFPDGWRIPDDDDWKKLEIFIGIPEEELDSEDRFRGQDIGIKLKVSDSDYPDWIRWLSGKENPFGFSALPAGYAEIKWGRENQVYMEGEYTAFWTTTRIWGDEFCIRHIGIYSYLTRGFTKDIYHSIRLVKDVTYD